MNAHEMTVRVYYEDTDLAGIVYYANYLRFLERGRTEMLRAAGIAQGVLKTRTGIVFVVTRLAIDYRRPARFDDLLRITTRIARMGPASVEMDQAVLREDTVLATAMVRLACIDSEGRPVRLPQAIQACLVAGDGREA